MTIIVNDWMIIRLWIATGYRPNGYKQSYPFFGSVWAPPTVLERYSQIDHYSTCSSGTCKIWPNIITATQPLAVETTLKKKEYLTFNLYAYISVTVMLQDYADDNNAPSRRFMKNNKQIVSSSFPPEQIK